jgi:hypothetical protein
MRYNFVEMCEKNSSKKLNVINVGNSAAAIDVVGARLVDKAQAVHGDWQTARGVGGEMVEMIYKDGYKELWEVKNNQMSFLRGIPDPKAEQKALEKAHADLRKFF